VRQSKEPLRQHSRVAESLWDNLDFIQAGFHISRFITTAVDTVADRENIEALYSSLKTTSTQINVSARQTALLHLLVMDLILFPMQVLVKHSQDKDQFLKVAIKWMIETQIFEDELKEVSELNSILHANKCFKLS
jgi:hypothetical protein